MIQESGADVINNQTLPVGFEHNTMENFPDEKNPLSKKVRGKRYRGLLEWILDRDGHEFLV